MLKIVALEKGTPVTCDLTCQRCGDQVLDSNGDTVYVKLVLHTRKGLGMDRKVSEERAALEGGCQYIYTNERIHKLLTEKVEELMLTDNDYDIRLIPKANTLSPLGGLQTLCDGCVHNYIATRSNAARISQTSPNDLMEKGLVDF